MICAVIVQNFLIVSCFLLYLLNQDLTKVHKLDSNKVHTLQYLDVSLRSFCGLLFTSLPVYSWETVPESLALQCLSTAHFVDTILDECVCVCVCLCVNMSLCSMCFLCISRLRWTLELCSCQPSNVKDCLSHQGRERHVDFGLLASRTESVREYISFFLWLPNLLKFLSLPQDTGTLVLIFIKCIGLLLCFLMLFSLTMGHLMSYWLHRMSQELLPLQVFQKFEKDLCSYFFKCMVVFN